MAVTTIGVSMQTRDLLKGQAAEAGMSLGAYVDTLARKHEKAPWWEVLRASIEANPLTKAQLEEDAAWDATLADGLVDKRW